MKTKYPGVYKDTNGKIFYQAFLGIDRTTGKRISKKSRKDKNGRPFKNLRTAFKELTNLKNDYLVKNGYANYHLTYEQFMKEDYLPFYKTSVERSTWRSKQAPFDTMISQFGEKELRDLNTRDCEKFRLLLLNKRKYSHGYASLIYGAFRKTLDYAVTLEYLDENVSKKTDSISKGKAIVAYWEKDDLEAVLSVICTKKFYEHMCFVIIWLYYMTGIRVSEGLALQWGDVDLKKSRLRVHHTLDMINQHDYHLKHYLKTESGKRTISLDADTVGILKRWKKVQEEHGVTKFIMSYTDIPLYRSTVHRIIKRYAHIAGVKPIQAKGLRHSHVSYLINEFNADVLTVSRRLGHSGPEITLKHYAHLWSRNDEGIADAMTGNIKFKRATEPLMNFNGNQAVKIKTDNSAKTLPNEL